MSVFTSDNEIDKQQTLATLLSIYLLGMMAVIAAILTAAMVLQYANGEIPCPLCLLQRVAMFGVCFGIILQFRHGFSYRNTGMSMIFSLFLLIVSVRQTLLDIYPRPGMNISAPQSLAFICPSGQFSLL